MGKPTPNEGGWDGARWIAPGIELAVVGLAVSIVFLTGHVIALALLVLVLIRHVSAISTWRKDYGGRALRFEALVRHSSDVILVTDASGKLSFVSPSIEALLGHAASSLEGTKVTALVTEDDRARAEALIAMSTRRGAVVLSAEWRVTDSKGDAHQVEVLVRNLLDEPAVGGVVLTLRDVTDRKKLQEKLAHQANHDDLTGLANRSMLRVRIEQALTRWLFQNDPFSLLVVDINDFKSINDSFGHSTGDAVLTMLARRIVSCTRRHDTVVRLTGDEFAILLEGVAASDIEATNVAERILQAISEPISVEGHQLSLRGSAGLACVTQQVSQADDIMRNADIALHSARSSNVGYMRFEMAMHDSALKRLQLEADLRRAVDNAELQLYYQPTVNIATGKLEGVEALLRWPHPERGFVSPAEFVPVAEESGLIIEIGTWVLRQACNEMRKWQGRYPSSPHLKMNVNLSARQLHQGDIVETVRRAIDESGIAPNSLVLEITETVLTDNKPSTLRKMHELVALGVELAIDDFGTGYSALSYLREFPLAILKIDRSFVNGVDGEGSNDQAGLVRAIIDLARTLRLRTVAEGIETPEQFQALKEMGCDTAQGFLLARPAPAEDVRRLIEATHAAGLPVPAAVA